MVVMVFYIYPVGLLDGCDWCWSLWYEDSYRGAAPGGPGHRHREENILHQVKPFITNYPFYFGPFRAEFYETPSYVSTQIFQKCSQLFTAPKRDSHMRFKKLEVNFFL